MQPQTTVTKRGANHGLHLVLTLLTCGLWAVTGWPIATMLGRRTKTTTYGPVPPPGYYPPAGYQHAPPPVYGQQPQQQLPPPPPGLYQQQPPRQP